MYMSQKEVLYTLEMKGNVEPGFTQLVWQKLEEQNKEFFQAYALRLQLRDQIALFNHLLEQQAQALQKGSGGAWARGLGLSGSPSTTQGAEGRPTTCPRKENHRVPPPRSQTVRLL